MPDKARLSPALKMRCLGSGSPCAWMLNAQGFPFPPERFASFGNGWRSYRGSLWLSSAHVVCSLIHRPWLCKKSSNSVMNRWERRISVSAGPRTAKAREKMKMNIDELILWISLDSWSFETGGMQGICVKEAAEPCEPGSSAIVLWNVVDGSF